MSGLLQNTGPVGVELPQEGLARWKPGFDQSYGLPGEEPTYRRMETLFYLHRFKVTAEPECKDEEEPVELVGVQQLHGLVQLVDGQQVGRCLQVLLLQTQLLNERLHRPSPRLEAGWRKKAGALNCCHIDTMAELEKKLMSTHP